MVTAHDGQVTRDRASNGAASEPDRASIGRSVGLAVDAKLHAPRMTLGLKGEFDLAGAPSLEREIEAVPSPQLAEPVLDLAEVTFIDSTGHDAPDDFAGGGAPGSMRAHPPKPDRVRSDVEVRDLRTRTSVGVAAFTARVRAARAELQRFGRPSGVGGRGSCQQFNRTRTS